MHADPFATRIHKHADDLSALLHSMSRTRRCLTLMRALSDEAEALYRAYPCAAAQKFMDDVCELHRVHACTLEDSIAEEA